MMSVITNNNIKSTVALAALQNVMDPEIGLNIVSNSIPRAFCFIRNCIYELREKESRFSSLKNLELVFFRGPSSFETTVARIKSAELNCLSKNSGLLSCTSPLVSV